MPLRVLAHQESPPAAAADSPRSRLRRATTPAGLAAAPAYAGVLLAAPAHAEPTKDQCIDANEAAQRLRKTEKLRDTEQRLLICVSASCPGPVRDDCAQRLTELRAVIPTVVFVAKDDADQDLSDVRVTMDAQPLASKLDGTAIAIDPGPHHFLFEAAGRQSAEKSFVIREGEKNRHERVVLAAVATVGAATTGVATTPAPESAAVVGSEPPARDGKEQRIAGLVVGGVGAAGVVLGSIFGIVSKSTYDRAFDECNHVANGCPPEGKGVDDGKTAHSQAAVATVGFIAGAALLGGGAILYFTAPKTGVTVGPTMGLRSAGVGVHGSW